MKMARFGVSLSVFAAATTAFVAPILCAAVEASTSASGDWVKPSWLAELSVSAKEGYDDNLLGVSGKAMKPDSAWVSSIGLKVGLNFGPLLEKQNPLKTFTLAYQPEKFWYESDSAENYSSHKINTTLAGKSGDFSFSLDNAFLYVDGNKEAPTYALNQFAGAAANQNDKFRNNFAHASARERRAQSQDRYNAVLQYSTAPWFIRGVSSLTLFSLNTNLHNTGAAPYKGYQNYADRYDINGGIDVGFKISPDIAFTVGYRDGYQYQQKYDIAISADQHASSNHYQRFLAGIEGKPVKWLTVKLSAGPDDRRYGSSAAMAHLNTTRAYAEGSVAAALPHNQTLGITYKQWLFLSSTGIAPNVDSAFAVTYHWTVNKQFGVDLGVKFVEANYTVGNDLAGSAPSLRDDLDSVYSAGITYAFLPQLILSASFAYDNGKNGLNDLAPAYGPAYRDFQHAVTTVGLQYKF